MPQLSKRLPGLDLLRALAITYVVLFHASEVNPHTPKFVFKFFQAGWIGVDLFFVLSGFLIARQVFKAPPSHFWPFYKNFLARRWWRTLPLYYFALFVYAAIKPLLGYPFPQFSLKFLVFGQNFGVFHDFIQSWSLCIEEHFYLFFPFLAYLFCKKLRSPYWWLGFVAISFCYRLYLVGGQNIELTAHGVDFSLRFQTLSHLDGLAIGVFAAASLPRWIKISHYWRKVGAIIGLAIVQGYAYWVEYELPGAHAVYSFTLIAACFLLVLVGAYDLKLRPSLHSIVYKIALYSYSIYIWNGALIRLFSKMDVLINDLFMNLLFVITSFLSGIPTYYLIEKTFLKMRERATRSDI